MVRSLECLLLSVLLRKHSGNATIADRLHYGPGVTFAGIDRKPSSIAEFKHQ